MSSSKPVFLVLRVLLMTFAVAAPWRTPWAAESVRDLPGTTLSAIRDSVVRTHNQVASLDVQYTMTDTSSDGNDRARCHRHHFAAKGRLRFRDNVHYDAQFPAAIDLNHTKQYFTVGSFDLFSEHQRVYEVSREAAKERYPWKVRADTFIDVCGWWPADDDPSTDDAADVAVHLRFVLVHPKYSLRETAEAVDGHACYVVEYPRHDRLWLDPELGFALRRRERYDPVSGSTLYRYRLSDFRNFKIPESPDGADIWFPMFASLESLRSGDKRTSEMRVEELTINQVADSVFRFVPPAGTIVLDRDSNRAQQIPGGRELLDESAALAQTLHVINTGADYTAGREGRFSIESIAFTAILVGLLAFNGVLFARTWS